MFMNQQHPCNRTDRGPGPYAIDISQATLANRNFRTALWTGQHLQTTLMCIPAGGEIGLEVHPGTDQFLRIESGNGCAMLGPRKDALHCRCPVGEGSAILVPAGTWHNLVNTGGCPLKLYSIYAPPRHPRGTVHRTKAQADTEKD